MQQTIGIIGAGMIGGTLAGLLTRAGHRVLLSNSRGPESLSGQVAQLGALARATTVAEAISGADLVIEAVPFKVVAQLPASLAGKILISASNYYPGRDGTIALEGRSHARYVADQVPGARVVRAFNTIWFEHLAKQGDPSLPLEQRRAIPVASDDAEALAVVSSLVEALGFASLPLGGLDDGLGIVEPEGGLYNKDLTLEQARAVLSEARTS